jgi:general secretion pathway protein D
MADRISESVTKIPILGDIPVLGFFFRNTIKSVKKSNIIIAITPYVVSDLSDLRRVAEKKLRERRDFIERFSSLEDNSKLENLERDLHKKRGMLEEINRSVREMEEDEQQLRNINERDQRDESMPIEPKLVEEPSSTKEKDKRGADKAAAAGADDTEPRKVSAAPGGDPAKSDNDE